MKPPRWLRLLILLVVALGAVLALGVGGAWWWLHPPIERQEGIVYGRSQGRDLTIDVLRPQRTNGLGVALMVSGSWRSRRTPAQDVVVAPLLRLSLIHI